MSADAWPPRTRVLQGGRYGNWTILTFSHRDYLDRVYFHARCDCGTERPVYSGRLLGGRSQNCGCTRAERTSARCTKPNNGSAIGRIFRNYRARAIKRDLPWELAVADIDRLVRLPCHYCGVASSNSKQHKGCLWTFKYNGIDRVDNAAGYTLGNVVPCCVDCNVAKRARSADEFVAWAVRVVSHHRTGS